MPQPRRSWRPGLRAQPARPPRFAADATSSHLPVRGSPGNDGQSHRRTGRTVSLAEVCGTVTPAPLRLRKLRNRSRLLLDALRRRYSSVVEKANVRLRFGIEHQIRSVPFRKALCAGKIEIKSKESKTAELTISHSPIVR
jgi:hypothetical protein